MRVAVLVLCVFVAGCRASSTAAPSAASAPAARLQLVEDADASRREIARVVPFGTPIQEAKKRLEAEGFNCSISTDSKDPPHLYCSTERIWKWPVSRVWHVLLYYDDNGVKDAKVTTGLVGP